MNFPMSRRHFVTPRLFTLVRVLSFAGAFVLGAGRGDGAELNLDNAWRFQRGDVAGAEAPLLDGPIPFVTAAIRNQRLLDVILVQPSGARRPHNSDRWLDAVPASRLFQIRAGDDADIARMRDNGTIPKSS